MWGQGIVDDNDEKTYAHVAGGNFFYSTSFLGEKHPFFTGEQRILMQKHFFSQERHHFYFFFQLFFSEGAQVFGEKLPHPKVDRAMAFPVVGFELGRTGPFKHASIESKNCTVNSYQHIIMCQLTLVFLQFNWLKSAFMTKYDPVFYCCSKSSVLLRIEWILDKFFCLLRFQTLVNQT